MMNNQKLKILLTFDLEEWPVIGKYSFDKKYNKSVKFSTQGSMRLLDLLNKYNIKCTFFTTGYFAQTDPELVRLLSNNGHEIACHSFDHVDITKSSIKELEAHIKHSKEILSNISKQDIIGFRAPFFHANETVADILEQSGFKYDSSVHPAIVPGCYYNFRDNLSPYYLNKANKSGGLETPTGVLEIPVSVIPWIRFPISWWWMRHMGAWITILGCRLNLMQKRSPVFYFHPWEFIELPQIKGMPAHMTNKCGKQNLDKLEKVIIYFKDKYKFDTLRSFMNSSSEGI